MRSIAIDCIAELIYQSTWKQSAYDNRLKGFLAESLAPSDVVLAKGYKSFKAGWILLLMPKERFRNTARVLYLTILTKKDFLSNQQKYPEIYSQLESFSYKHIAVHQIDFQNRMQLSNQFSNQLFLKIDIKSCKPPLKSY